MFQTETTINLNLFGARHRHLSDLFQVIDRHTMIWNSCVI